MRLKKCIFTMTAMVSACSMLMLTGCDSKSEATTTKATQAAAENTVAPTASAEATVEPTASPEATTEATASPEATKETETADAYKPGTLTATEYKNEFIGLEFKATDKYLLATKEIMEKAFGTGAKIIYGDKSDEVQKLSKDAVSYEMMAYDKSGFPNLNICVQDAMISTMTEKDYMEAFSTQMASMTNVKVKVGEGKEGEFCGEKYLITPITMTSTAGEMTERIYLRKKGNTFILLTVGGKKGADKEIDALLANFKSTK